MRIFNMRIFDIDKANGHASIEVTRNGKAEGYILTPARITPKRVLVRINGKNLDFSRATCSLVAGSVLYELANITEGTMTPKGTTK